MKRRNMDDIENTVESVVTIIFMFAGAVFILLCLATMIWMLVKLVEMI
ncbi:MAG: hypothetical protein IKD53_12175 [Clostridia bacterium]|nr:hypothetical protein [Clostridia bacterium]